MIVIIIIPLKKEENKISNGYNANKGMFLQLKEKRIITMRPK